MFPRLGVLALLAALLVPASAEAGRRAAPDPHAAAGHGKPFFDSRARKGKPRAVAASARVTSARRALAKRLGPQGVVDVDPDTGTPRVVQRLDGALTGPSTDGPAAVALSYVRANAAALGLGEADIDSLRLDDRYTTPDGLTVLRWIQVLDGIPAFDNGLKIVVDRAGRVVTVSGSPAHGLAVDATVPAVSASSALAAVQRNVEAAVGSRIDERSGGATRATDFEDGSRASLVVFTTAGEDRLAWDITTSGDDAAMYHAVVDAESGRVLYRANLTKYASNATIYPNYPGAPGAANAELSVDLAGWLPANPTRLFGPNVHVYSDLDAGDDPDTAEEIEPSSGTDFVFGFTAYNTGVGSCSTTALCSWDDASAAATRTVNRRRNGTQAFWFINTFHDHLAAAPINFTAASGGFEGTDRVLAETLDGASTGPSTNHLNNANMSTPPDGTSPQMQMYLFSSLDSGGVFRDVNGGDAASIVYHEYTHGLSNRLVVTAAGAGALASAQSGAMGEAWSDWYAMDLLNLQGREPDTVTHGEVDLGTYTDAVPHAIRSQALDCPVGADAGQCPASGTAGSGGYTYGDFGTICCGGAEVHADGEIWAQTLWDLRKRLIDDLGSTSAGAQAAERLVTDGMRLSPPEPSFLDMRNAILAADTAAFGGAHRTRIWEVFKTRGMGFFASTLSSSDVAPIEDFSAPPTSGETGAVAGRITDAVTGLPVAGLPVGFGGHATKPTFADYFATTSGSDGRYALSGLPVGTYPQLIAGAASGYDGQVVNSVAVASGGSSAANLAMTRDWAASGGGATVSSFTGPDYEPLYGCGPAQAIDQSQGAGWSTDNPDSANHNNSTGPEIVVELPQTITVTSFAIDPSATCGDGASATLRTYRIETSTSASGPWTVAKDGTGASALTLSQAGTLVPIVPTAGMGDVRFVRLTLLEPQGEATGQSGKDYIDISEFAIYGAPPNTLPTGTMAVPATGTVGQSVTLTAAFTDPDSAIDGYDWDFDGNGTVETSTASPTTTTTYASAGSFSPRVSVRDFRGGAGTATAIITVAGAGGGGETVGPDGGAVVPDGPATAPPKVVTPAVSAVGFAAFQRANRVRLTVTCATACTGTVTAKMSEALAKRLNLRSRVAGMRRLRLPAGTHTVVITFRRAVLRRLRAERVRKARFQVAGGVTDSAGLRKTLKSSLRIAISRR